MRCMMRTAQPLCLWPSDQGATDTERRETVSPRNGGKTAFLVAFVFFGVLFAFGVCCAGS
jgi:hypothetical protein